MYYISESEELMAMDMMGVSGRINNEQVKKEQYLLQRGDIIHLEPGMKVYTDIPLMFCGGKPFEMGKRHADVCIGEIYKRKAQSVQNIVEEVYEKIYRTIPASKEQISAFVDSLKLDMDEKSFDTSVYAGEYEVYHTASNGGGTGGGGFCYDSVPYPDGWHVYCHKVEDPSVMVDFYQTGHFTAMIENIEPINK